MYMPVRKHFGGECQGKDLNTCQPELYAISTEPSTKTWHIPPGTHEHLNSGNVHVSRANQNTLMCTGFDNESNVEVETKVSILRNVQTIWSQNGHTKKRISPSNDGI